MIFRKFYFYLGVLALSGCSEFLVDEPVAENSEIELQKKIVFKTKDSASVYVKYWIDINEPKYSNVSSGLDHAIDILFLKESTSYNYQILSKDSESSDIFEFKTDSIKNKFIQIKKNNVDSISLNGYILLRRFFRVGADMLIDTKGDLVWYHKYEGSVRRAFSWTEKNTILSIYDTAKIKEIDLYGNELLNIDLEKKSVPLTVNHEIIYDNDEIIALSSDSLRVVVNENNRSVDKMVVGSGIVRLNKSGDIIWRWTLFKNTDYEPLVKSMQNTNGVLGHANSIAIDKDDNYLISFRDFNQIWKVDKTNGKVIWKLGKGGDFDIPVNGHFIKQHSIYFNDQGHLAVFDNGDLNIRPNSRILAFELDEINMVAKVIDLIDLPRSLSSYRMCSAYKIDQDKYLVCTSRKDATVSIVDKTGKVLWSIVLNNSSYRAYFVPFTIFSTDEIKG